MFLKSLPDVVETMQWSANLVFWVGDKAVGGKMFALVDLDGDLSHGVACWCVGADRFDEVLENEGLFPARYLARAKWVAAREWGAMRNSEWEEEFRAAHEVVRAKLPKKVTGFLELPEKEQKKLVAAAREKAAAAPKKKAKRRPVAAKRRAS